MNPHFFSLLMQNFLSGYGRPCDIKLIFFVMPMLFCDGAREKLVRATKRGRMDSLFEPPLIIEENRITGKSRLSGFTDRYKSLESISKEALIILFSENKVIIERDKVILLQEIDYKKYKDSVREWFRAAYYLGVVFAKETNEHLSYYLGVDI